MSSRINFNDDVSDRICFTIQGLDYDFIYPTAKEWSDVAMLTFQLKEEKDEKKIKSLAKKIRKAVDTMVVPVGHDVSIDDTLESAPLPVSQAFNKKLQEWLNPEG